MWWKFVFVPVAVALYPNFDEADLEGLRRRGFEVCYKKNECIPCSTCPTGWALPIVCRACNVKPCAGYVVVKNLVTEFPEISVPAADNDIAEVYLTKCDLPGFLPMDAAAQYEKQSAKPTTAGPQKSAKAPTGDKPPVRKDSRWKGSEGIRATSLPGAEKEAGRLRGKTPEKPPTFADTSKPQGDQASMFAFWMLSCSVFTAARQLLKKIKMDEKKRRRRVSL